MAGSRTKWWIYRFELAYFNPCYKRWALFQENPFLPSPDVPPANALIAHRIRVQGVLDSVRKAFEKIPRGALFDVIPLPKTAAGQNITLKFDPPEIAQKISDAFGPNPDSTWKPILTEYSRLLREEGLDLAGSDLPQLTDDLSNWPVFTARYPSWSREITASSALQLLSTLPILPHWDLWGAFYSEWERPAQKQAEPSLLQLAGRLAEPFYVAHLKYLPGPHFPTPHKAVSADPTPPSVDLLGYEVRLELAYCDLSNSVLSAVRVVEDDYFRHCCNPKGTQEELPYLVYAYLIDNLQRAIPGKHVEGQTNDLYYMAYPVFTPLGRRHFLDIYVYPEGGQADLGELWDAWRQLHDLLQWKNLQLILEDELEEIDLGYSEARLAHDMGAAMSSPDYKPGQALPFTELVCRHGHILFPVRAFRAGEGATGAVFSYKGREVNSFPFGEEWAPGSVDEGAWREVASFVGKVAYVPDVKGDLVWVSPISQSVTNARRDRLVREHLEFAHRLWQARETERDAEKKRIDESKRMLRRAFLAKAVEEQLAICQEALHIAGVDDKLVGFNQTPRVLMKDCVARQASDTDILGALREVFAWSYTLLASEYFGLGPIKGLTHGRQWYTFASAEDFRNDCTRQFELAKPAFQLSKEYAVACGEFHQEALRQIAAMGDWNGEICPVLEKSRKAKHQFHLMWGQKPFPEPASPVDFLDSSLEGIGAKRIELYLPVHEILKEAFEWLSKLHDMYKQEGGRRWAFALGFGVEHSAHWYPTRRPTLHRNYFAWTYPGSWTLERLRAQTPKEIQNVIAIAPLRQCGILSVAFKAKPEIRWMQWRADEWCQVAGIGDLLPRGSDALVRLLLQDLAEGCAWFLTFDSWMHE
ncbi:MAG TPA: hypothetical protein VKW78_11430 [Terriglobales bacterium]|nr:hypothetical protein [Terriglobales bacterium]HZT32744.1 hypothetical protein [Bryobacteraceae bacterium]